MSDGCLVAHEVLHYINKTKRGTNCYAALKLDMSKAFDRVSWHFLMSVMRHMGFPIHWRNLIWECISTVSYRILINGTPSQALQPTSGLRQGDPTSPYLFILCMEVLSRQLAKAERMKSFTGIKISRYAPPLSHLFYADDALLCCKATNNSFEALRDLLKEFEVGSGQMINLDKSYIKFSPNTPVDFRDHLTTILKMPTVTHFGDYLGVPIDIPRKKSEPFLPLIDKITTRITSWTALHLSQSSKLILISSILLASLNHILSCVPLPHGVCRKIDALITAFWWRNDWNKNTIHWLRREILQSPKEYGGLGIKNTFLLSQSLLLKNFWRITTHPNTLLAKFWTAKYKKDLPIPTSKSSVSNVSYAWTGVCRSVDLVKNAICWKLGSGKLVDIWSSRWVNGELPSFSPSFSEPKPSLSSFILESGDWNPSMLFRYFSPKTTKDIIAMEPPAPDIDDFIYWKFTEDGRYSAKSGYFFLWSQTFSATSARSRIDQFPWQIIWTKKMPRKLSILIWRMAHNILPTNANLLSRGVNVAQDCHLCHSSPETMSHLFRSCTIVQHLWKSSWLGINPMANPSTPFLTWMADFLSYLNRQSFGTGTDSNLIYFGCVLRAIWTFRNWVVFKDCPVEPAGIHRLITDLVRSNSQFHLSRSSYQTHVVHLPFIKNAGFTSVQQEQGVCILLSTHRLPSSQCFTGVLFDSALECSIFRTVRAGSLFVAPARLLVLAMCYAEQKNYTHVTFQVTSRKLSTVLANSLPVPITVRHSVFKIRTLFVLHPFWSVSLATG
ncbi:uncharacterized protein LOC141630363 [Silene latifolia]|uniref:uncharacterized protein LOC141630363 n=1 Tax=Silene latifolia TaxID=37657 RepID=UPI003D78A551